MKLILSCLGLFVLGFVIANEDVERINYDWEEDPTLTDVEVSDSNISIYILKNFLSKELIDVDGSLYEYNTIHKHVKLLTDKGIEQYNRVYLPVPDKDQLFIEKARVITSKGEVIPLKEEDIKEGIDEETEQRYRYFAFDGVDLNAEVEYIYMYRRSPSVTGNLIDVQKSVPQINYSFELIAPYRLIFAFKSYNNLPEIQRDTSLISEQEKLRWFIDMDTVNHLPRQRSSAYDAELMYFGYKLSKNLYSGENDMFSYGEISKRIYQSIYESLDKKDMKKLNKIYKKIPLKNLDEEGKIRAIDNFVKEHLTIYDISIPGEVSLEDLWEAQIANESWATRILANLYRKADINVQVGLTSDRFKYKFDESFELWSFPSEYFFYFPSINAYGSPGYFDRLNQIDYSFLNNNALFVKVIEVGGEEFGVGNVDRIPVNDYKLSGDTLVIDVDIAKHGFDELNIGVYHSINGYKADYFQPYYEVVKDKEQQEEFAHSLINFLDNNGEVENFELQNASADLYGVKPVIATAELKTSILFDRARDNQLFKVGELIGPQMEMYDNEDRELPVEDAYARHYHRVINFTIPDGYSVQNLDDLIINEVYKNEKNKELMAFKSSYEVDGNTVAVTIDEYYKGFYFPLELFEEYTRVINAAADFNKIVLVFKPE